MSRFLFYMGHPAHYHNFKIPIKLLLDKGHEVKVVARDKDVLFELLDSQNWDIEKLTARKSRHKIGLVASVAAREARVFKICKKWKPDLLAGTDLVITHVGKLLGIPSVVVNEDDSNAVPLMARLAFPFATAILAPNCCDQSPSNHKKIGYESYQELTYLHPDYFTPNRDLLPEVVKAAGKYFILRFASLHAHHDKGKAGITDELAMKIIEILKPFGQVFITSERPFSNMLEDYRLRVHPKDMHQVLAFASMYIGDSQTMAAEAAVLGVPSVRFNDFVGELSYLEELENRYKLTRGIKPDNPEELIELIKKWVEQDNIADEWKIKQTILFGNTISPAPFWVEVFENLSVNPS
ncbi:MAG: DUF354 domain-containing protein [Cryomorphaceae bacterium]